MTVLQKIVALTGAGISAESGITTFRDAGGLWEQHDVMEVASIEGWHKNPEMVLRFYNDRRRQLAEVEPNAAHRILAFLEKYYDVTVVTQNVDDLHERAGSTKIIHLHGELTKASSSQHPDRVIDIGYRPVEWGEKASDGSQLRPHIVWFGEAVPMIEAAAEAVSAADVVIVVGTSLNVYPAAGLVGYAPGHALIYLVDPNDVPHQGCNMITIREKATVGMAYLRELLVPPLSRRGIKSR